MIATTIKPMVFFNRNIIKTNWKRINESPLKRAGLLVRRIARGSIRRGSAPKKGSPFAKARAQRRPSKRGRPPKSWRRGGTPPFKMIYSLANRLGTSAIVGMVGFGKGGPPVPGLQEHGGTAVRRVLKRVGQRRTKKGRIARNIMGLVRTSVRYPKRPFMQPALEKARSKLPPLWRRSLN